MKNHIEDSYNKHSNSYLDTDLQKEFNLYYKWFDSGTVDVWRHLRSLDNLLPLLKYFNNSKWISIGDGRFGTSAMFINKNGGYAIPLDIDDKLLKIAKERGMITDYCHGNAESIPFDDNTFDFAHCKEAFHHFPRPYIALYEMIRVCKIGVVLSEPADWIPSPIPRRIFQLIKHLLFYKLWAKKIPNPDDGNFESIGNYVFSINEREIIKICTAMNLNSVAFKRYHDVYIQGVENELISENGKLFRKIKSKILKNKILRILGFAKPNRIVVIVFKNEVDAKLMDALKKENFSISLLSKSPF